MSLVHCIYTSRQTHPMSREEIDGILRHSREKNPERGISGILLYVGGYFMQVLEGDADTIDALYAKILVDTRHTQITRIILEAIPHRYFGEWTMALSHITVDDLAEILDGDAPPGLRENLLGAIDEGRAKKLLRAFTEGRWRTTLARHDSRPGRLLPGTALA